ncbi:MAG TPA: phosphomannomutase/phosphoglucomutase [Actinomycetota bacterium]|jgi:phosphomannomutase
MAADLERIFKAYDIRGVYPEQFDEGAAYRIGRAFASWAKAERIVLGRDCRLSSPPMSEAFASGVTGAGVGIVDIGLATTDMVYFASGRLSLPGAMFTASHNPPEYNGLKLCLSGARPVGVESGLKEVRALAEQESPPGASAAPARGLITPREMRQEYIEHLLSFVDLERFLPFTVVADAANGMAGLVVPELFERLPGKLVPLYMDLDGTFPNHPADPIDPKNQEDVKRAVLQHGADLGLAFDGDADRVFLVDEHARGVGGSLVTALVAIGMLEREPGATILHNLICSRVVPEVIREHGGTPVKTRVGHSFIKKVMAETGAVFGGEHSGHYYFRAHYNADSGLVASMVVMDQMSKAGKPLSELLDPLRRYADSGEINSPVEDKEAVIQRIAEAYRDARQDRMDGLTVEYDDWWFNVRPSNTEPLLRLNVEAATEELLKEKTAEVLALINHTN